MNKILLNLVQSFLVIFCLPASLTVIAQNTLSPSPEQLSGALDFSVPQSAAFAILGVSPEIAIEPSSGKTLVASVLQGLNRDGNFQSGVAIEFSPYEVWFTDVAKLAVSEQLATEKDLMSEPNIIGLGLKADRLSNKELNYDAYKSDSSQWQQYIRNIRVGFASAKGLSDNDESTRYAVSLNWAYRFNDVVSSKARQQCFKKIANKLAVIPEREKNKPETLEKFVGDSAKCNKLVGMWTITGVSLGAAWTKSEDRSLQVNDGGYGVWASYSQSLITDRADGLIHLRLSEDQLRVNDGALSSTDSSSFGARFRYGTSEIRLIGEGSWERENVSGAKKKYGLYSVGGEFKISDALWFRLSYGDVIGSNTDRNDVFSGQLRYGFGSTALSKL